MIDGFTTLLLLTVASGGFNGTFPVFIKTERVLAARVHPIIFQLYKSVWVCIFGCGCAAVRLVRGLPLEFTPWASLSAAAWIPSGVFTIIAVPLVGVGASVLTTAAVGSALSFLVFWLAFHEKMKVHDIGGHELVLAPFYMGGVLVGMVCLVLSHQAALRANERRRILEPEVTIAAGSPGPDAVANRLAWSASPPLLEGASSDDDAYERRLLAADKRPHPLLALRLRTLLGYSSAALSGVFSALQYGLVCAGQRASGVTPGSVDERFDALGSWLALFGLSALLCTLFAWLVAAAAERARGQPVPSVQFGVMWLPGSCAGICWSIGSICATVAVLRGGNAVTMAQINAAGLITSGAWGLLWYREIRGRPAIAWVAAAAFTAAMAILLGLEKQQ